MKLQSSIYQKDGIFILTLHFVHKNGIYVYVEQRALLFGQVYLWNNTLVFHMYHKVVSCLTLTFITKLITWYILNCLFQFWFRRHVVYRFYQVTAVSFRRHQYVLNPLTSSVSDNRQNLHQEIYHWGQTTAEYYLCQYRGMYQH